MAQNNDLAQRIKEYLELDRQIESFNQKTGELRKKRTALEESLIKTICSRNMDNKMLTLNKDLGLVCQPNKVLPNLTIDIIKLALSEKISNSETVNQIVKHIITYRDKHRKTSYVLKKRKPGRRSFRKKKV